MNILLFGHTGFIGKKVYDLLSQNPLYHIKTLSSKTLDFNYPIIPPDLFDDIDVVINAVGVMSDDTAFMENIHHHTPACLATIAKQNGIKHWLNLSALGADEYSPIVFVGSKGRGDKALLALADDDFSVTVIRPSLVFGQGGASIKLFLRLAKLPIWVLPNGGHFIIQPVHVDDVALGFLHLLSFQKNGIINMVGSPILLKDYLQILANNFYKKQPIFIINIPLFFAKLFLKMIYLIYKNPLFSMDNLTLLENSQVVDENDFIKLLGKNTHNYQDFTF